MHGLGIRVPGAQLDYKREEFVRDLVYLEQVGFDSIEISAEDFDVIRTGELDIKIARNLKKTLKNFDFHISVHTPLLLNLFNRDNPALHREVLEACMKFTDIIGGDLLVYHPGRYIDNSEFARYGKKRYTKDEQDRLKEAEAATLRDIADRYPGIMIACENLRAYVDYSPYSYAEYPWELAAQVRAVGSKNVGMMIDTGHLQLSAGHFGFDISESIKIAGLEPVHFHINDNHGICTFYTEKDKKGQLPFGRGDEHIEPGLGIFPFQEFLSSFPGYGGRYIIELTSRYFYPAKIEKSFDFLEKILKKIKKGKK